MGLTGESRTDLVNWTTKVFAFLFFPSKPGPQSEEAIRLAIQACEHIDALIQTRKASGEQIDDGLGRALLMQSQGVPGMTDLDIRNNLFGIAIGAVPTTSKCVALVVDYLLDHPDHFEGARAAAISEDWATVNSYVNEALRFRPFGPALLRTCTADTRLAKGTWRSRTIKQGTTVAVTTLSAMWDGRVVKHPRSFSLTRPPATYFSFGEGQHGCFGARINAVQIPRIVGAVITRNGVQRAVNGKGHLEFEGQFPSHLRLTFAF